MSARLKLNVSKINREEGFISAIMSHTIDCREKDQQLRKENKPTVIAPDLPDFPQLVCCFQFIQ
jgi:hypothetical protein